MVTLEGQVHSGLVVADTIAARRHCLDPLGAAREERAAYVSIRDVLSMAQFQRRRDARRHRSLSRSLAPCSIARTLERALANANGV